MANVQGLFERLAIEKIELVNGGYLISSRLEGTYTVFKFFVCEDRIIGYSNRCYYRLTETTQDALRRKFRSFCREHQYLIS